jgi:rubrerythrin
MDRGQVLVALANNELLISKLYQRYSENVPEMRNFWLKLVGEEIHHHRMILELNNKIAAGEVFFDEKRFKLKPIELVQSYLSEKIEEADSKKPSARESLAFAADVENSLLERKIFTVFDADSEDLKELLISLTEETRQHLLMVQEKLASMTA